MGFIRLLLALIVVLNHIPQFLPFKVMEGRVAVQCFYIISGFYMALVLTEKYQNQTIKFYKNRFLKIYPLYWISLLLIAIIHLTFKYGYNQSVSPIGYFLRNGVSITDILLLFQQLILVSTEYLFFFFKQANAFLFDSQLLQHPKGMPLHQIIINPPAWTLSLEVCFYLFAPFLNILPLKKLLEFIGISILIRVAFYSIGLINDPFTYRFFPTELALFLFGMLLYHNKALILDRVTSINKNTLTFILFLGLIIIAPILSNEVAIFSFLLLFGCLIPILFEHSKQSHLDNTIGKLSYPMYILHFPIIFLVQGFQKSGLMRFNEVWFALLVLALTILFSFVASKMLQRNVKGF